MILGDRMYFSWGDPHGMILGGRNQQWRHGETKSLVIQSHWTFVLIGTDHVLAAARKQGHRF